MTYNGTMPAHPVAPHDRDVECHYGFTKREAFAAAVDVSAYKPIDTFEGANGRRPSVRELADYIAGIRLIEADAILAALDPTP